MKNHLSSSIMIFGFCLFSFGCVTVDMGGGKAKSASHVKFEAPSSPFEKGNVSSGDQTWISKKTGNSISFISECERSVELSLEQLESDALNVMEKLKIEKSDRFQYNGREALKTLASGKVDGIDIKMQLVTFKKNNCNYNLSYVAVASRFDSESSYFEQFAKDFQAP